jgi:hypothetical protein
VGNEALACTVIVQAALKNSFGFGAAALVA